MVLEMTEKVRLFGALDKEQIDRVPCACPLQTGTVDLMGLAKAWWPDANNDPIAMARLAKAGHVHAGIESVRVPFDITVDASAFGARTGMESIDRQPAVIDTPYANAGADLEIEVPNPLKDGRSPILLDAIRALKADQGLRDTPIICGVTGPFMLTCQLRGMERAMMDAVLDPNSLKNILEKTTSWCCGFVDEATRSGADVIAIIDATSSGDILGPDQYRTLAMPHHRIIAGRAAENDTRSILHVCGDTSRNLEMMASCGFNGISVDQSMDIAWVSEKLGGDMACIGNVSPISSLLSKDRDDVVAETLKAIGKGTDVVAPGCGFAPRTPLMNMRAMVDTVKRSGKRY